MVGEGGQVVGGEDAVERSGTDGWGDDEEGGGRGGVWGVGEIDFGPAVGVEEVVGAGAEAVAEGEEGGPVGSGGGHGGRSGEVEEFEEDGESGGRQQGDDGG